MVIVVNLGTFWMAYCPVCAWQGGPANDWKAAEQLRTCHRCAEVETIEVAMPLQFRVRL